MLRGVSAESGWLQAWLALANIEAADVVKQVHVNYLRVGADIIISNNLWTSPTRLSPIGWDDRWQDLARAACENARRPDYRYFWGCDTFRKTDPCNSAFAWRIWSPH